MKNNSFDRAMGQIVAQAEAERVQELKLQQRAMWFGRVRTAFLYLFIVTVLIFGYQFRDKIGQVVATVMPARVTTALSGSSNGTNGAPAEPAGKAALALEGAAKNAAARDSLIDSLAK
ncbi:MAG TPA: hypothetical protein VG347_11680 [Verrucomicrobiae bacterium]|nr:hypothetical protein [Verrucomicrobiae bacterium]